MTLPLFAHLAYLGLFVGLMFPSYRFSRLAVLLGSAAGLWFSLKADGAPFYIPAIWFGLFFASSFFFVSNVVFQHSKERLDPLESFLKKGPFALFENKELKSFAKFGIEGALKAGEPLLKYGQQNTEIFCVIKGELSLNKSDGEKMRGKPGTLIGIKTFFGEMESDVNVQADVDSVVMAWSFGNIEDWVGSDTRRMSLLQSIVGWQMVENIMSEEKS